VLGLAEPEAEPEGGADEPAATIPLAGEDGLVLPDEGGRRLRLGPAALTGEAVGDARAELVGRPPPAGPGDRERPAAGGVEQPAEQRRAGEAGQAKPGGTAPSRPTSAAVAPSPIRP
jgi:hypothetical protein